MEFGRIARASSHNKMLICRDVDVEYDGVQVLSAPATDSEPAVASPLRIAS